MKQTACLVALAWALICIVPSSSPAQCLGDFNGDGRVSVDELVTAVNSALYGCPATPEPTLPSFTSTPTNTAALAGTLTSTPATTATPMPEDRFVDNADGTITDNKTGLMWEKKVKLDRTVDYGNLHDADDSYPWCGRCSSEASPYCQPTAAAAALCAANVEGGATGCDQCTGSDGTCNVTDTIWTWVTALNAATFAGHADWRVPKREELRSLIDYAAVTVPAVNVAFQGASCGGACTDIASAACSCTNSRNYWSASTDAPYPTFAWFIYFGGDVTPNQKLDSLYVRAVRGGS
jgi:hypothetical protein